MPKKKRKGPLPRRRPQSPPEARTASAPPDSSQREARLTLLLQTGRPLDVIRELDAIPPASLTATEGLILVAAYSMLPNEEGSLQSLILSQRSLRILDAIREKSAGSPLWFHSMGCTLQRMGQDRKAEEHFRRFLDLQPGDAQVSAMIADCQRRRRRPVFPLSFRQRVEMTWQDFLAARESLERLFDSDEQEESRAMSILASCLFRVIDDFPCSFYVDGGKYHLAMWIDGSEAKFLRIRRLLRYAPAALRDRWVFHVGQPQDPFFEVEREGIHFASQNILAWADKREDGGLRLRVYVRDLLPMIREQGADSPQVVGICRDLVSRTIGEVAFLGLNCSLEVLSLPVPGEPFQLCRLPFELGDLDFHFSDNPEESLQRPGHPWPLPVPREGEPSLRDDILEGVTWCLPLVEEYQSGRTDLVDDWHEFGIAPCFLGWPASSMVPEEAEAFRNRLTEALRAAAGGDAFDVTGWARGSRFHYLDLVAWDCGAVLRAARTFFRDAAVPGAFFHSFYPDVSPVPLTEDAPN